LEEYPELSKDFLLTRYRQGLDGLVGLDNVSDQKHLTAKFHDGSLNDLLLRHNQSRETILAG